MASQAELTTYADVSAAAVRLRGRVLRTPLLESLSLNLLTRARVLVKAECLQTGGSFKIRGALHRILMLSAGERQRGHPQDSDGCGRARSAHGRARKERLRHRGQ